MQSSAEAGGVSLTAGSESTPQAAVPSAGIDLAATPSSGQ